jgi:hypothetical protein
LVKDATKAYATIETKHERMAIVSSRIVNSIRSKGTGFVKQELEHENGEWIEVGNLLAREKVGEMLRNALSTKYRSSVRSKKRRRRDVQAKRTDSLHDLLRDSNESIHHSMVTLKEGRFHGNLSDQQLMVLFTQEQCNILTQVKADKDLVDQFLQAEVTACLVLNDDDTDSNGDVQMREV